ncbi:MAG TPA: aminoacyl-tRNA deacylase [Chloroflexi bacterium]|jgi:Cys-tRNA(Pro)/Cys-tRNA(Cys) deacylase|nr:aminoacyl-tRNA deacylase [Chloroflexota bacterium]
MAKAHKTNAMRLLDGRRIPYVTHTFSPDIHSAEGVAEVVGMPPEQVFKTLVVLSTAATPRPYLAIIPGHRELDLKKLAQATGEKKLRMASQREAEALTGLQVGGISALALLNKGFTVYLDATAEAFETILVSAGQRGINLELAVADLVAVTGARTADLSG